MTASAGRASPLREASTGASRESVLRPVESSRSPLMAAPAPAIDLDATVARLRALPEPQKISLSGALAVLMGRRSHGWNLEAVRPGSDGPPFCAWLLEHIMVVLLQLPAELLEGLKPLTEPQA